MFKVDPLERLTIGQIISLHMKDRVKDYIHSEDFKKRWTITRETMIIMKEETQELHKVVMDEAAIATELDKYQQ